MTTKPDDLEAIRTIVATLSPFDANEQERIIRWSREKLGLQSDSAVEALKIPSPPSDSPTTAARTHGSTTDIKAFVADKAPSTNNEFTAVVAYFYRFEAAETARKDAITADDLQEACRLAGRSRLPVPGQTLINAHQAGLLDKAGDRGAYAISTVGENLVAMALPSGGKKARSVGTSSRKKTTSRSNAKASQTKKPGKQNSKKT
jgi:hypothetical protein